jgi:hypothetical protein
MGGWETPGRGQLWDEGRHIHTAAYRSVRWFVIVAVVEGVAFTVDVDRGEWSWHADRRVWAAADQPAVLAGPIGQVTVDELRGDRFTQLADPAVVSCVLPDVTDVRA